MDYRARCPRFLRPICLASVQGIKMKGRLNITIVCIGLFAVAMLGGCNGSRGLAGAPLLERAARGLASRDVRSRTAAVQLLRTSKEPKAAGLLAKALKDSDERVRFAAALATWQRRDKQNTPLLANCLADPDSRVRSVAACALRALDPEGCADLLAARLKDQNAGVRLHLARLLAELGDKRGFGALDVFRSEKSSLARSVALECLAELDSPQATRIIIEMVADKNFIHVGPAAEQELRRRVNDQTIALLIEGLDHPQYRVRRIATWILGGERAGKAVGPLIETMNNDEDSLIRDYAARALGEIGDPAAIKAIVAAYKGGKVDDLEAAYALRDAGAQAVPALAEMLDLSTVVADTAAEALGEIGDPAAIGPLVEALRSPHWFVQSRSAESLIKFGERAVPALIAAVEAHANMAACLEEITGRHFGMDKAKWETWYRERKSGADGK